MATWTFAIQVPDDPAKQAAIKADLAGKHPQLEQDFSAGLRTLIRDWLRQERYDGGQIRLMEPLALIDESDIG